jgi:hypothetical protein
MWWGEAFYKLLVQHVKVFILLGALFPPIVNPASQQFWSHGANSFCFCTVVAILESPPTYNLIKQRNSPDEAGVLYLEWEYLKYLNIMYLYIYNI